MPRWSLILAYMLIALAFAITAKWSHDASVKATQSIERIDAATQQRVKESCATQKTRYTAGVLSLKRTYSFLEQSSLAERRSTINKFVLAGLPKQEQDLRNIVPASFCAPYGPKVPPMPRRPESLKFK